MQPVQDRFVFKGLVEFPTLWDRCLFHGFGLSLFTRFSVRQFEATSLCWRITALEASQQELMRDIARKQVFWPVLARRTGVPANEIAERLAKLDLGRDFQQIDIPFREAAGADENYPARRWAKEAIRCLAHTRLVQRKLAELEESNKPGLLTGNWKRESEPAWVLRTKHLPD